ncbi:MAG: hypothetical protein PVF65_08920 [Sphingomonadales bacterium]|jgi:hypothetical protein
MTDKTKVEDLARAFLDLWEDHLRAQAQGKKQLRNSGVQDADVK